MGRSSHLGSQYHLAEQLRFEYRDFFPKSKKVAKFESNSSPGLR